MKSRGTRKKNEMAKKIAIGILVAKAHAFTWYNWLVVYF